MEKNFKNSFGVTGTLALRKAFREELLALGWKQQGDDEITEREFIYCSSTGKYALAQNHFWYPNTAEGSYKLPEQYEEALKAASEVVVEIPEYVKCIKNSMGIFNVTPNKIYKVISFKNGELRVTDDINTVIRIPRVLQGCGSVHTEFKPSTKEAFDAQNKPIYKVGDWVIVTDAITKQPRWSSRFESVGYIFQLTGWKSIYISEEEEVSKFNEGSVITSPDNKHGINYIKDWVRLATPEEIATVTKPKLPTQTTLTLGTSNIKITVYKDGKVEAEGKTGNIQQIRDLIKTMRPVQALEGWKVTYPSVSIGCSTFGLNELQQIILEYDKLNPTEW